MDVIKHSRLKFKDSQGFTLSEVLMSVFIFSMLAAACYTIMASSSSSWQVNRVRIELQQELRKSQSWMMNELRQSGASSISAGPTSPGTTYSNSITFKTANGISGGTISWSTNTIQFLLSGTQLQRVSGGVTKVLAQNISSFQIRRQTGTPNLLEISLQAQKNVPGSTAMTGSSSFKVQMRN